MLPARLRRLPAHHIGEGAVVLEAATARARLLGLAGLDEHLLPPRHALLLRPCRSVHTFGMRFDLALVFLTADGRIALVETGVPPARIRGSLVASAVLEIRPPDAPLFIELSERIPQALRGAA
jgi:uncharacterized protein